MHSKACLTILCGAVVSLAAFAGCSSTPKFHVGPHVGYFDVDGDVTVKGQLNNLQVKGETDADEMGLDDEFGLSPRLEAEWDDFIVGLSGIYVDYSGNGTAKETLKFGRLPEIQAGSRIESDLTLWYLAVDGLYRILTPDDFVEFGLGLGLGAAEYDVEIKGKGAIGGKVEIDGIVPFGYLAAMLAKDLGPVRLQFMGKGMSADMEDEDIDFYELDGNASLRLWGEGERFQGRLVLGYRFISLDYTEDDDHGKIDVDADIQGPYVSLVFTF